MQNLSKSIKFEAKFEKQRLFGLTNQPFLYIITFRFLKNVLLAQSVEHFTFNEGVAGSSPAQDTIFLHRPFRLVAQDSTLSV